MKASKHPRTRGECVSGPRPCPWTACRFHLAPEVAGWSRGKVNLPELVETCALDVADRGGASTAEVAELLGVGRGRVNQVEVEAMTKLRHTERAAVLWREARP